MVAVNATSNPTNVTSTTLTTTGVAATLATNTSANATSSPGHCTARVDVPNASEVSCAEGALILPDSTCAPRCERGFLPTEVSLNCFSGSALPDFECLDLCGAARPLRSWRACDGCWCRDMQCGRLVVMYGVGLALAARGLLAHLACADFHLWVPGRREDALLVRADIWVVTAEHLDVLEAGALARLGFTGAIVLVDLGCDAAEAAKLPQDEVRRRLLLSGLAPPVERSELEALLSGVGSSFLDLPDARARLPDVERGPPDAAADLFERAGRPPHVPPALRCWDRDRTLYVGADRAAAAAYADAVEAPPGAFWILGRAAHGDLPRRLGALRAGPLGPPHPSAGHPKLLAYWANAPCLPEAEAFFDMAVGAFARRGDLGAVEALGDCHGSRPEARPPGWNAQRRVVAERDLAAALVPYRFVMAFEASAAAPDRCPRHVGLDGLVLEALVAGAVPVYRGAADVGAVLNASALLRLPVASSVKESFFIFRDAAACEGAAGWFDGGADRSCDEGCAEVGLGCSESALRARNSEVDSSAEVLALLRRAGGSTSADACEAGSGEDADAPQWGPGACLRSAARRDAYSCAERPRRRGEGRHRLCYCHAREGCVATGGWRASAAAVPAASLRRWFDWDRALEGAGTELQLELAAKLAPLAASSPRARCATFGEAWRGAAGFACEGVGGRCVAPAGA